MRALHRVPYSRPVLGDVEASALQQVIDSGRLASGKYTKRFEEAVRKEVEAEAALATDSCTAALHLALLAQDVGPGDEVITTPMTFCATANVIEHTGARTVFMDVDKNTLNLNPEGLEQVLTPRTKGILAVHFAGLDCRIEEIRAWADDHGLFVIEDAAHAFGTRIGGRPVGSGPSVACFSFHETKTLTTGSGGMLTGPSELVEKARPLSLHGMAGGAEDYDVATPGWKYNMNDLSAAVGLAQLSRFPQTQERRREVWGAYDDAFTFEECLMTPIVPPQVEPSRHMYLLRLHLDKLSIDRDAFARELSRQGVETSVHFIPLHLFSHYKEKYGHQAEDFPNALAGYRMMLGLPMHGGLEMEEVVHVVHAVLDTVDKHRA